MSYRGQVVIVVDTPPARRMLWRLWKLKHSFAIAIGALYVVLGVAVSVLALGGFYVAAKLQEHGSLVVAGMVAICSVAAAGQAWRRSQRHLYDMLRAVLEWTARLAEANARSREQQDRARKRAQKRPAA